MTRRLVLGLLVVLGILFPVSIIPERGGGGHGLASDVWSPPVPEVSKGYVLGIDSIPARTTLAGIGSRGNQ